MPNLIEVQKNSYKWFLEEGLKEVFKDISEISDYQGNLVLDFIDYRLDETPKYTIEECKERDATYAAPLRVRASLLNKETGEVKEQDIFMGDFPVMTPSGTFIINGAERVIVSQLVRSPGVYYGVSRDKAGKELFSTTVIPNRGAWLEYETDSNDVFYVRIDKNRKLPVTTFIRALGLSSDGQILEFFGDDPRIVATIEKDSTNNTEEALLEVYRKLRPGEPPTVDSAQSHLNALFFDARRYDLSRVGRYKYNKKLGIASRINGHIVAEPIINSRTGEVMAEPDEVLTRAKAEEIERAGVDTVFLKCGDRIVKVISNGTVAANDFLSFEIFGVTIPTGLLLFFAACCLVVWLFMRSKTGIAMSAAGANPRFAAATGINVDRMRIIGTMLSTMLAAVGIIVYGQSYGFMQLYQAPRQMGFLAASAILIGGATTSRAKISNVVIGTFLFQGVLTLGMPVANALVPQSTISETLRILISNGIILYALTKSGGANRG